MKLAPGVMANTSLHERELWRIELGERVALVIQVEDLAKISRVIAKQRCSG